MFAIIMAAGEGTRLRPHTLDIPKPMVKVDGKPILEYQIEQLKEAGINQIIIIERYLSNRIQEYFGDGLHFGVSIAHLYQEDGSAGAVRKALIQYTTDNEPALILNGDIISDLPLLDLVEAHRRQDLPITIWTKPFNLSVGVAKINDAGVIADFKEKPLYNAVTGICVVNRSIATELTESGAFYGDVQSLFKDRTRNYTSDSMWLHISDGRDLKNAGDELRNRRLIGEASFRVRKEQIL
ncbi:nucleotidyltransferase family protein [Candidatus Gottesmanbacteria bacterium]|nr:nucleotidyltransferase family protein [Candidatus Gottesmanbacteria bacterium]